MFSLQAHHIVDLYVWVDETLPKPTSGVGRPSLLLSRSELITLLIWNTLLLKQKTLKDLHAFSRCHLASEFPRFPKYNAFLEQCHQVTPQMFTLLELVLTQQAPVVFMDSTMVPVCTLQRADSHRVAKKLARFGKNHQGWHYGFKLHMSISEEKTLAALALTPANIHDAQVMPALVNRYTKVGVGDSLYGAKVMGRCLFEKYGTVFIAPPHYKQKKKRATPFQNKLLSDRSKIESVFDYFKEHLHLVSSFPRSVFRYLVHYVRILLGYQIMALARGE